MNDHMIVHCSRVPHIIGMQPDSTVKHGQMWLVACAAIRGSRTISPYPIKHRRQHLQRCYMHLPMDLARTFRLISKEDVKLTIY
jgi:hypothetical protein